jgi:hypothetical protein
LCQHRQQSIFNPEQFESSRQVRFIKNKGQTPGYLNKLGGKINALSFVAAYSILYTFAILPKSSQHFIT